jgi:hypothetical protein
VNRGLFPSAVRLLAFHLLLTASLLASELENPKALEARALAGDRRSQYLLGLDSRPLTKKESEQNLEEAYAWFKSAAVRGYYPAAFELEMVTLALNRTGRAGKASERYNEISAGITQKPKQEVVFRHIADPAIGYKFYASNRWGEPKIKGDLITLQLRTGGVAWLRLDAYTREQDKEMRTRIKSPDPVLAMELVEGLRNQFGDARLVKHGPWKAAGVKDSYYVVAEIPADKKWRSRISLVVIEPSVNKLVTLQFTSYTENFDSEWEDFSGVIDTYSYTSPHLTRAMEDFVNGLNSKK